MHTGMEEQGLTWCVLESQVDREGARARPSFCYTLLPTIPLVQVLVAEYRSL